MTDHRTENTRHAIKEALLRLLTAKPLAQVTVAELAAEAGVSRSTFYVHYANTQRVLTARCARCRPSCAARPAGRFWAPARMRQRPEATGAALRRIRRSYEKRTAGRPPQRACPSAWPFGMADAGVPWCATRCSCPRCSP